MQAVAPKSTAGSAPSLTGGQLLVECLRQEGIRHAFLVPGESYLAALDALYDAPEIRLITNRQEGGACFMAEAYGKATRSTGVCFVTRGPGATNASIGVHCADQDSTPLVLFVGQVPRANRGREAFQEIDYGRFFGGLTKWVTEVESAAKLAEVVPRAFHVARSGRPGPVVVALPEDVLVETAAVRPGAPYPRSLPYPDPEQIKALAARIRAAKRPLALVGGGVLYSRARQAMTRVAEQFGLPVSTSFRRMDAFPNSHSHYVGGLNIGRSPAQDLAKQADLFVVIGDRLSEITTNDYTLIGPGQELVQVDIEPKVLGRNHSPSVAVAADARLALEALLEHAPKGVDRERAEWVSKAHQQYLEFSQPKERPTPLTSMERVMRDLDEVLPKDAILTSDAGNFSGWVQRYYRYDVEDSFLGPTVGSMGYGVPSAIAAKLAHPRRVVVGTCGDGGFMMTGQELATAVQFGVNIVQLVINNGMWGTIRMHQERDYPGRKVATDLVNPDFAAMARAMGAEGYTVNRSDEFRPALEKALACGKPALLDVRTDPEHITVATTLTELRARNAKGGQGAIR
ncbi:MAG TPA: thiamine pyrophosphate-dependent enzyme [bacterium]|nr:thiamine pyrophosphate-dependent enzyme [bacterium]